MLAQPALAATAPVTSTQSTVFAGYNFANYIAVPGAVSAIIVVPQAQLQGHANRGELNLRRRRHPIRELVRPSVPGLHAATRGSLLPIARGKWQRTEHRKRRRPSRGHDRVRGVPERLESDRTR